MPSVYTIEGSGRRGRKRKGGRRSRFKAAHSACVRDGYKPFTKSFGKCMRDQMRR